MLVLGGIESSDLLAAPFALVAPELSGAVQEDTCALFSCLDIDVLSEPIDLLFAHHALPQQQWIPLSSFPADYAGQRDVLQVIAAPRNARRRRGVRSNYGFAIGPGG